MERILLKIENVGLDRNFGGSENFEEKSENIFSFVKICHGNKTHFPPTSSASCIQRLPKMRVITF